MAPGYKRSTGGWQEHHLGTGVQAVQLSPYRAGLAEPALQRFGAVAALPTCYFPPGLSLRGGSVGPRTFSEFFPVGPGILCRVTRRTEGLAGAHLPHDVGALVGYVHKELSSQGAQEGTHRGEAVSVPVGRLRLGLSTVGRADASLPPPHGGEAIQVCKVRQRVLAIGSLEFARF